MENYFNLENKIMPSLTGSNEIQPTIQTIFRQVLFNLPQICWGVLTTEHFPVSGRWTCQQELISPKSKMKILLNVSLWEL